MTIFTRVLNKIQSFITPEETTSASGKTVTKNTTVPMVSEEAVEAAPKGDYIKKSSKDVQHRTLNQIYEKISWLCEEYRMSLEDVKKAKLLEKISGFSGEELERLSDKELEGIFEALKHTLKYLSWKLPWNNRTPEDIEKIAKQANKRYIYRQTGRSFVGNLLRANANIIERLTKEGCLEAGKDYSDKEITEALQKYYHNIIDEAVRTNDKEKIKKAYDKALKIFGDMLNDNDDPKLKQALTAVIEILEADKRLLASNIAVRSCGTNDDSKSKVAKGISDNYEAITCKTDALNQNVSDEDSTGISKVAFSNMTAEDSKKALENMNSRLKELQDKKARGEALTEEEQRAERAYANGYAGAYEGTILNTKSSEAEKRELTAQITAQTEALGIKEEVLKQVENYIKQNPQSAEAKEIAQFKNSSVNNTETVGLKTNSQSENKEDIKPSYSYSQKEIEKTESKYSKLTDSEKRILCENPNYSYKSKSAENKNPEQKNIEIKNNVINPSKSFKECLSEGKEGLEAFRKLHTDEIFITEVFNNFNQIKGSNRHIIDVSIKIFEKLSSDKQMNIMRTITSTGAFQELINHTSDSAIVELSKINLTNSYMTQIVDKKNEELEKNGKIDSCKEENLVA